GGGGEVELADRERVPGRDRHQRAGTSRSVDADDGLGGAVGLLAGGAEAAPAAGDVRLDHDPLAAPVTRDVRTLVDDDAGGVGTENQRERRRGAGTQAVHRVQVELVGTDRPYGDEDLVTGERGVRDVDEPDPREAGELRETRGHQGL